MSDSIQLPWPTFPEEFVIGELLQTSSEFQRFYREEREKIVRRIYWARDLTLPEGIDHRNTRIKSGKQIVQVIRLRRVPASVEDAFKIAHELEHSVLDAEGFPTTGFFDPRYESLSSALSSMVADLIVDSRLQKYGFNLRADYEAEVAESIRQLERFTRPSAGRLDRTRWIFNYVGNVLYWELLDTGEEHCEFQAWFDGKFPHSASRAKKLLARVKRIEYDTPEKQKRLFQEIIRRYKLEKILTV